MKTQNPLSLNRSLSFIMQTENPETGSNLIAARISLGRLSAYLTGAAIAAIATVTGTLLFFRELEINRKLQEHVLRLESEKRLYQTYPLPNRAPAETAQTPPSKKIAAAVATPAETMAAPKEIESPAKEVFARINELRTECSEEECSIKTGMVTTQQGTAVGTLLLVLETEVPRIGSSSPNAPIRKRFFIYPGNATKDELDPNSLPLLEHKAFRFSRVLQTTTVLRMGKFFRPLAINAYVFDPDKTLLQHERRTIENEDSEL
jgi:hypothetical protein